MTRDHMEDLAKAAGQVARGVVGGGLFWGLARALVAVKPYYKGDPHLYAEAKSYVGYSLSRNREILDEALEELRAQLKRPR